MQTREMFNPFVMPKGLSLAEANWWVETTTQILRDRATADRLHQEALDAQFLAEHARSDYGRLRQEYRERYQGRIPQWAADIRFKGLSVAQECLVDDTWYSRQATEKSAAANACYATVVALMEDVSTFLRRRTERMLAEVPEQRRAS